ncbi:DUF2975 domain-containing protein [Sneathiella marina]|uniref:DUF2975 domain-containing protein n=1 Tax=Sneathiella marina TaxID=2950108 RepID=A0ABY4W4N5_9PROT|nr:DUF2975 domain-containing protein [Sneathiella marina]USG60685.1 DUF2975 domain-containing protein [Sneathiella marina]
MQNFSKIKTLSNWIYWILSLCIVIIPVYYLSFWFLINNTDFPLDAITTGATPIEPRTLPTEILAAGYLSSIFPLTVLVFVLLSLRKIFQLYKKGIVFSLEHVALFKKTAKLLVFWVLVSIAYESVKSVLFSLENPPGEKVLSIGFGSDEVTVILVAAFVYVIAWVMDEGRALAEENEMTI